MTGTDISLRNVTWLKNNINNNELSISDNYAIYRKDRSSQCVRGEGGVTIAIKKTLNRSLIYKDDERLPVLFFKISQKGKLPLNIGDVHRKPINDTEES